MIRGSVTEALEALIEVGVEDRNGAIHLLDVVIDTGFTGYLVLPQDTIRQLGLAYIGQRSVILASGGQSSLDAYSAIVSWHDQRRNAIVFESNSQSLLGMSLLLDKQGYHECLRRRQRAGGVTRRLWVESRAGQRWVDSQ